jgi:hypothetical protein
LNCLELRFGSDSSNYYYWQKNQADLVVGWNWINNLNTTNAGTTGTPVITACDYTLFKYNTNLVTDVVVAGDLIVDDMYLVQATDFFTTYVSGYPQIDETNLMVTTRLFISTAQANGFSLNEFGLFNADNPKKLFSRVTHTPITKTSAVQIFFVQKDMIA